MDARKPRIACGVGINWTAMRCVATTMLLLQISCASALTVVSSGLILARPCFTTSTPQRTSLPGKLRMNSAVVPLYRGLAAASVLHGCFAQAPFDQASVLVATAIAASFDLGPAAARQIASATNAQTKTPGAAANRWFALIGMKIAGQIMGLLLSAFGAALVGASCIIAADALFWLLGGGEARYGMDGPAPIPAKLSRILLGVNAIILLATIIAIVSPPGFHRIAGASVYSAGILLQTAGNENTRKRQ